MSVKLRGTCSSASTRRRMTGSGNQRLVYPTWKYVILNAILNEVQPAEWSSSDDALPAGRDTRVIESGCLKNDDFARPGDLAAPVGTLQCRVAQATQRSSDALTIHNEHTKEASFRLPRLGATDGNEAAPYTFQRHFPKAWNELSTLQRWPYIGVEIDSLRPPGTTFPQIVREEASRQDAAMSLCAFKFKYHEVHLDGWELQSAVERSPKLRVCGAPGVPGTP
ncbi:hypothetical protein C8T65DRAFT_694295 [Cerioporus squamosus]|nr:hypothetical protein C8T65DRAFT_694295 [Cerioporus squamosus]